MHLTTSLLLAAAVAAVAVNATALSRNRRVIGGVLASEGDAPYSVSLQNEAGEHFCGGVIVSKNTVLTSAVCAKHLDVSKMKVKAGSIDLAKATQFNVTKAEVHPDYSLKGKVPANDLAALRVEPAFDFADGKLKAAVLPTQGQKSVPGETVTVAGWGASKVNGTGTTQLMKIKIRIVGAEDCNTAYKQLIDVIPEKQICAGSEGGVRDACQLDGGSGMVLEDMVLGLVSWGMGCGQKPGVYTELAPFRFWIDEQKA